MVEEYKQLAIAIGGEYVLDNIPLKRNECNNCCCLN